MKMYVDMEQYLLTASFLAPSVLVSYLIFFWLAKLLAKLTGHVFGLPLLGHVACIVVACAAAPIVARWFTDRPADLMGSSGKALLIGAIAAFFVVAMVEETGRHRKGKESDATE
jgi:hypothetical protein